MAKQLRILFADEDSSSDSAGNTSEEKSTEKAETKYKSVDEISIDDILSTAFLSLKTSAQDLFSPPFSFREITVFITALIDAAESLFSAFEKAGPHKKKLVIDAFNWVDRKYGLIRKLDDMVKFKGFWTPLEALDQKIIKFMMSLIIEIILMIVDSLNLWGKVGRIYKWIKARG